MILEKPQLIVEISLEKSVDWKEQIFILFFILNKKLRTVMWIQQVDPQYMIFSSSWECAS
jgi:hypothetical protein